MSDSSLAVDSEAEASLASSTAISSDSFMLEPAPTGSRIDSLTRRADAGVESAPLGVWLRLALVEAPGGSGDDAGTGDSGISMGSTPIGAGETASTSGPERTLAAAGGRGRAEPVRPHTEARWGGDAERNYSRAGRKAARGARGGEWRTEGR